jgi:RimJ/RimL family protein N-acetyltransferase
MRHTLTAEGFGVRLRPARMDDAAFIVWLRGLDHAKGKLGDSATTVAMQKNWLESYFDREGDYYFIAETLGGIPVGTIGIYDAAEDQAEFGRLIISPGVQAAVPASILAYDLAFNRLELGVLRATSVASNLSLHSFIKKLGYQQVGVDHAARVINGEAVNIFNFLLTADEWQRRREKLIPLAGYAARRIAEWESRTQNEIRYGSKTM